MNVRNAVIALSLVALFGAAQAEERALNLQDGSSLSSDGLLQVVVGPLPKGLFTTKNMLDRSKSIITLTYDIVESDCHPEPAAGVQTSDVDGAFVPLLNSQGKVNGYDWQVEVSLAAQQNHWHNHLHCDGQVHVHGCDTSRPVTLVATLNNPGDAEWGQESVGLNLAPVQDPDQSEDCAPTCDTTSCEATCNADCDSERDACRAACPASGSARGPCISGCNNTADICHGGCACDCRAITSGCESCDNED